MLVRLLAAGLVLALAVPAHAQQTPAQQTTPQQPAPPQPAAEKPAEQPKDPDRPISFEEQVIVTASRADQQLIDAPASVSVISAETIRNSPATNVGDLLRTVPGVNVAQLSARDINITTRGATSTLATSQLALVDGRSVYLDFFGMVMWDLVPTNANEIKQIEVVRGPASAVWGANAMTGVVNVITKTPRELAAEGGTTFTVGAGYFDRDAQGVDNGSGGLFYVNGSHAEAVNDRWAYKITAGYFAQDPFTRPTGTIDNSFNTPYPPYTNTGTSQPKFDVRVDHELGNSAQLVLSGGVAGTEGIIHSGIGPFDIDSGSRMTYFRAQYGKGTRHFAFFTNLLNGDATNFLARDTTGAFLPMNFNTKTFDFEASDIRAVNERHVLSFGGNYRYNAFDISIAPSGDNRHEGGAYLQDEIFLHEQFRAIVGARMDKFSSIENVVFSPRASLLYKPTPNQTMRVSFNQAFRAPSYINNNLNVSLLNQVNLSAINPAFSQVVFPFAAIGNPELTEERLTAFELGYSSVLMNRATVSVAVYWNKTDDGIFFTQSRRYTTNRPPPFTVPPVPAIIWSLIPDPGVPSEFTYQNLGTYNDKGFEIGVDTVINRYFNGFINYSYQADPVVEDFDPSEINHPANNRFNIGVNFNYQRYLGNLTVSYTDEAYWQDVLDARYAGTTDPFTLVNFTFGLKWMNDRLVTSAKVMNLLNQEVQQHVFGDIMKRQVVGEVRFTF